jgi:uncharacterized protein (DUF58 family)
MLRLLNLLPHFSLFSQIKLKRTSLFYWTIFAILLLFGGAYVHNNNIAFLVMFFIGSVGSIAILRGRFNLKWVEVAVEGRERGFANRPFSLYLRLSSKRSFDIRVGKEIVPILKGEKRIKYPLHFPHRGKWEIKNVEVESLFPLYLARFSKKIPINLEIIVYPEPRGMGLREFVGYGQSFSGERGDFEGVREYREGDSVRDIHWGSVAKGNPMAKKFEIHSPRSELFLDYDALSGSKEERLSQLTKWVLEGEKEGIPFKVKLGSKILSSKKGIIPILEELALF